MPRAVADRVGVLWTGTGTGTLTLGSSITGFQGFPSSLNGETVAYTIKHNASSEAEAGFGVYTSSNNTLSRVFRTYPTFGGAAVSFSAGDKTVRLSKVSVEEPIFQTTNPTVNDDIDDGYLEGRSTWLNRTTNAFFICCDHTVGAAVWTQVGGAAGAVSSVNTQVGAVVLDADDLSGAYIPTNYTPGGTGTVRDHFVAIDGKFLGASADAAPGHDVASGATYELLTTSREHLNRSVWTSQATQRLNVPVTAPADSTWVIRFLHAGAVIGVTGDAVGSSINGTNAATARGVNGGIGIVDVHTNAGSAPVVLVRGDIIFDAPDVTTTKTYTDDDHTGDHTLTTNATQTFNAASTYRNDFYCNIWATSGTTSITGTTTSYSAVSPDNILIKKVGPQIWASGKHPASPIIISAT